MPTLPASAGISPSAVGLSFRLYEAGIRLALGLSAVASGLVLLLSRGYQGAVIGILGGLCCAAGVYALVRAAQCWRGRQQRQRAFLVAGGAALVLAVSSCCFLSHWVQQINEIAAWHRYEQAAGSDARERLLAYQRAVPEPFQRRQAEADYLLALVRSGCQPKDTLHWTLEDLQARYGDDPTFDPVRQAIREALQETDPST